MMNLVCVSPAQNRNVTDVLAQELKTHGIVLPVIQVYFADMIECQGSGDKQPQFARSDKKRPGRIVEPRGGV